MRHVLLTAAAITMPSAALANDSTATTGAGGLVLERTEKLEMASEDLFVSTDRIHIHYVFRNPTAENVDTIVAFPMPDRDLGKYFIECGSLDVAYPTDFRTTVAGVPVKAQLERKVALKGHDYTALLKDLRIPIAPDSPDAATRVMDRLPLAQKRRLQSLGLAKDSGECGPDMKHSLVPLWTVKDTYWWKQRFPAGRDLVIDHQYVPGTGSSQIGYEGNFHYARDRQASADYCEDRGFVASIERYFRAGGEGAELPILQVSYVLTTGANWRSPIGDFRLVVDKGKPDNLVSFCETGVKKIGPTRFEVRHKNWRPTRDLDVLIVGPAD